MNSLATVTIPETHRDLLETNQIVTLATFGPAGSPQVTALWFLVEDDDTIAVSLNTTRQKTKNLMRRPEATLFFVNPAHPCTLDPRPRRDRGGPRLRLRRSRRRKIRRGGPPRDGSAGRDPGCRPLRAGQDQHLRIVGTHELRSTVMSESSIPAGARIGHVHLKVADLDRAVGFYRDSLGFDLSPAWRRRPPSSRPAATTTTSVSTPGRARAARRRRRGTTGLYHFAINYPERRDLAAALKRL